MALMMKIDSKLTAIGNVGKIIISDQDLIFAKQEEAQKT